MRSVLVISVFLLLASQLSARDLTVCKTCEIQTIGEAVKRAESGDRIFVRPGEYKESGITIIGKSITIIGENYPVVNGQFRQSVFEISADHVTIKGLKIINVGRSYTKDFAAILLSRCSDFHIEKNILKEVFFGILIEKSSSGEVLYNNISSHGTDEAGSGNGIHAWHCSKLTVRGNNVKGLRDGIYFEFVKNSRIGDNLSANNLRYGLHFMFSNHNEYFCNTFERNGAGVAVMFSKFTEMHHNTFRLNWGTASYGLLLKEISDANIYANVFEKNTVGISGEGSTRIDYRNNSFKNNGWAVKIKGACYTNEFRKNDFIANSMDISYSSNLNDNRFSGNYWSEYTGYDLDKDGIGDVPHPPVKLFSYVVNKVPEALVLLRSLFVDIINFSEKVSPVFTPGELVDINPAMKKING